MIKRSKTIKLSLMLLVLFTSILLLCSCKTVGTTVYDKDGKEMASLFSEGNPYMEVVRGEAIEIVSELEDCSPEEAEKHLKSKSYMIYTAFDEDIYSKIADLYRYVEVEDLGVGCAITDLKGHLVAVYSNGEDDTNNALRKTAPYSSIKPLSVYSPALERGIISWSSCYEDSPVKKIVLSNGNESDWPSNASNTYSYKDVDICDAIKNSLNTVAVKCIEDYGVEESMKFLEEKFSVDLAYENKKMKEHGSSEIVGNVALGYLENGVSPIDMAGYYQVFANGGKYQKPKTILKIEKEGGEVVYQFKEEAKQVIGEDTSYIMNRLLQTVVSEGGTGSAADIPHIDVGGKTGTGPNGNWFVGFTPKYSCAIWHDTKSDNNIAASLFGDLFSEIDHSDAKGFVKCDSIKECVYCKDSGSQMGRNCMRLGHGYYKSNNFPPKCIYH